MKYLLSQRKYDITFAHSIKNSKGETEKRKEKSVRLNRKDRNRNRMKFGYVEKNKERREEKNEQFIVTFRETQL